MLSGRLTARKAILCSLTALCGCASAELNYNTLDLASTTNSLVTRQVLFNLANFIDSDLAYPAQVVLNAGTATTTDSLTGTYSAPLDAALTTTNQIVRTVTATQSTAFTGLATGVRGSASAGVGGVDTRTQNWSYTPVTNSFQANRLMALYRYVVDNEDWQLKQDYAKLNKSVSYNTSLCLHDNHGKKVDIDFKAAAAPLQQTEAQIENSFTRCANGASVSGSGKAPTITLSNGTKTETEMVPDPYYLRGPTCVLCIPPRGSKDKHLQINQRLMGHWLHWHALPGASGMRPDTYMLGDVFLGIYGHYELYVDWRQQAKFPEFVVFILAASTQVDTAGASGTGSAGGNAQSAKQALQSLGLGGNCIIDPSGVITCP
jgi:hypothetical protein